MAATDPDVHLVVELGDSVAVRHQRSEPQVPAVRGRALDLIEGLSLRTPLDHDLADEDRWMIGGLAVAFDQAPPPG